MTHEVQLAIYDLSHGMAKSLSAQFLGPQHAIDIIPHTGIVVYGKEYFFGGGIQSELPHRFRQSMGIQPIQVVSMGQTSVTQSEFESWCQEMTNKGLYTMASYDLLHRNCNNFTHDAAMKGLKLSQGVPDWILGVPHKFLSSPMGQMVRPMLENMQVTGNQFGGGGGGGVAPFANMPTSSFTNNNNNSTSALKTNPQAAMENPWANIPSTKKSPQQSPPKPTSSTVESKKPAATQKPVLDSFHKPLISSDSNTVVLCVKKLVEVAQTDSEKQTLEKASQALANQECLVGNDLLQETCQIILTILQQQPNKVTTFALMFLRVLILQAKEQSSAAQQCLEWIETQLSTTSSSSSINSHAARAMAWACLSNAVSLSWWQVSESLITDTALRDLSVESQPRTEVRQMVSAFVFNFVLQQPQKDSDNSYSSTSEELPDTFVTLLCATMESIESETDATTRLRRLLSAARILVPQQMTGVNSAAKGLLQDLGFQEAIEALSEQGNNSTTTGNTDDAQKCQTLATELLSLLRE